MRRVRRHIVRPGLSLLETESECRMGSQQGGQTVAAMGAHEVATASRSSMWRHAHGEFRRAIRHFMTTGTIARLGHDDAEIT